MPQIIFWNVNRKDLTPHVCSMMASTNADAIVLIESIVQAEETLHELRLNVSDNFDIPDAVPKAAKRFHCFCRTSDLDLSEILDDDRTSVRRFQIGQYATLLILVHGIDMRNHDPETRQSFAQRIADNLRLIQEDEDIRRVILLGDFNLNPFDRGINSIAGLNAMMTRECVKSGYRTFYGKRHDFYYNPMWGFFGDNTDGPAGTIYDTSNQGPYGWSMFDQVIIHHSVVGLFNNVRILTEAGTQSLMNKNGRPDKSRVSDHFPILVTFREDYDE